MKRGEGGGNLNLFLDNFVISSACWFLSCGTLLLFVKTHIPVVKTHTNEIKQNHPNQRGR